MNTVTPAVPTSLHAFDPESDREPIVRALKTFVARRANLQRINYGSNSAHWKAGRLIARDKRDAERLFDYLPRTGITANDLLKASRTAYSGRLSLHHEGGEFKVEYTIGQHFPTEYRRAVCAVLASAIHDYERKRFGAKSSQVLKDEFGAHFYNRWFA